jgi:hypothetical protein
MAKKRKEKKALTGIIFVVLKLMEIAAVLLGLFLLFMIGKIGCNYFYLDETVSKCINAGFWESVGFGFLNVLALIGIMAGGLVIFYILYLIIKANWNWARRIAK